MARGQAQRTPNILKSIIIFVTDNIRQKQMRVEYCLTENMQADCMTKPLQGCAFRKFWQETMNLPDHLSGL
eukprot:9575705-Ditylum_brightwellii.AAC.1